MLLKNTKKNPTAKLNNMQFMFFPFSVRKLQTQRHFSFCEARLLSQHRGLERSRQWHQRTRALPAEQPGNQPQQYHGQRQSHQGNRERGRQRVNSYCGRRCPCAFIQQKKEHLNSRLENFTKPKTDSSVLFLFKQNYYFVIYDFSLRLKFNSNKFILKH